MPPQVSVIIPSAGAAARSQSLFAALDSVQGQAGVTVRPIVVLNGNTFSPELLDRLRARPGVQVDQVPEAGLPRAIRRGRELVATEYFCFLDDDDLYLPDTLQLRTGFLAEHPDHDCVVTNGWRSGPQGRRPAIEGFAGVAAAPVEVLMTRNWLASCGGLFRASTITPDFFDPHQKYFEWTLIAFKLALRVRVGFLDVPTYVIHETEGSLSASVNSRLEEPAFVQRLVALDPPASVRRLLSEKLGRSHHSLSVFHLSAGEKRKAWQHHVASLFTRGGLKYLTFTRKFLLS